MTQRPMRLDEYATFLAAYTKVIESKDAIVGQAKMVQSLYDILVEYGGKVPPHEQVTATVQPEQCLSNCVAAAHSPR